MGLGAVAFAYIGSPVTFSRFQPVFFILVEPQ